ncbi:uncharacterized protein LOC123664999 [Melitaea cinxia]|uniref:uncharacterized protein LOC123664999 n=1 Tax=Melitaea cinxia TaxID=113334 RepID=UPI001E274D05|nr:uncharacterized protein LOC123664999 [Melitaea cinxia]
MEIEKLWSNVKTTIFDIISTELSPIREEIAAFKQSISFMSSQYESLCKKIDMMDSEVKTLQATKTAVGEIKSSIIELESQVNNREQWARRSNVEIYGVPERKGENLMHILECVSKRIDFPLDISRDVDFVTRVASKNNNSKRTKPIIVRFLARYKKDDFLSLARKFKFSADDLGFKDDNSKIFFNDHLTSVNKSLLQRVKVRAKENKYLYTWVKNCAIMVRRTDTSPIIHISSVSDLNKIK